MILTRLERLLQGQFIANKSPRYELILEEDHIRVVSYIEAVRFWDAWWRLRQKGRREF